MSEIPQYISKSKKAKKLQALLNEALYILKELGIPVENLTDRRKERMAMAFLAVANVKAAQDWINVEEYNGTNALKSREIIKFWNLHFDEAIAESSYDDIRRKDLKQLVLSEIIVNSC